TGREPEGLRMTQSHVAPCRQALPRATADTLLRIPIRNGSARKQRYPESGVLQRGRRDRWLQLAESRQELVRGTDRIRTAAEHEDESLCTENSKGREASVPARR